MDISNEKAALRRALSQRRGGIAAEERACLDRRILSLLLSLGVYRNADVILCYVASRSEPETRPLIEDALASGKKTACPRCADGEGHMAFLYIDSLEQLVPGRFGLLEPGPALPAYDGGAKNGAELCVVPGLSFDPSGGRLGYGKGYYDRFLAGFNGTSIGLCYERTLYEALPRGEYDRRVDYVVTEERIILCG